jgi:Phage major capsid protein E
MAFPPQDRLIRKETALGTIREIEPPQQHIGTRTLAPFLEVASDDVIFDYAPGLTDGLAPARAEDAESELAQKDLLYGGVGRASVIDWSLKDHYTASDVSRYREALMVQARLGLNSVDLPLTVGSQLEDFRAKVARDDALRRRKLDNRIEWLITQALELNQIVYNDGKIKFTVAFDRPAGQTNAAPANGLWSLSTSDPIRDLLAVQDTMYNLYGVRLNRGIASRRVLNSLLNSDKFTARSGLALASGGTGGSPASGRIDPYYLIDGWGPSAAQSLIERATNISFIEYDAVYRTRPIGGTTITNNRFLSDNKVFLLPDPADLDDLDDAIGFGRTLTSPHPEGNWSPGFYEWESETRDPWGQDRGAGIKAFPVFPQMQMSYTMTVL